jgi:DNA-binding CsgD family transcriptional regulator
MPLTRPLSPAEQKCLGLIRRGLTTPKIATLMEVSETRVNHLRAQNRLKLGLAPTDDIAEKARQLGLL